MPRKLFGWTGAAVTVGTAVLLIALPSRSQQQPSPADPPVIVLNVPATAPVSRAFSRVEAEFALPAGYVLVNPPKVRAARPNGTFIEERSMYALQLQPAWKGYGDLLTDLYAPEAYDVTVEVTYQRPNGSLQTVVSSPVKKLIVTGRPPAP